MPENFTDHEIGVNVLKNAFPKLDSSPAVLKSVDFERRHGGVVERNDKDKKISLFLSRIEKVLQEADPRKRQLMVERFRSSIHDQFVIKAQNIPNSYFDAIVRQAREEGHGDVTITPEMRRQAELTIVADQKANLDSWIDYLTSEDAPYPVWFKYICLANIVQLKPFDKEKKKFPKRDKSTVAVFPELNPEALGFVCEELNNKFSGSPGIEDLRDKERWQNLLKHASFNELYGFATDRFTANYLEAENNIGGNWRMFPKGSEPDELRQTLEGKNTGWCTASSEVTARSQLAGGDFWVYYTNGNPRIGIRMFKGEVAEVRGVGEHQHLQSDMVDVARKKLMELEGGEAYEKKVSDMRTLTEIERKMKGKAKLTADEISFLWEINSKIEGFGYQRDPRIDELKARRDFVQDYTIYLNSEKLHDTLNQTIRDSHCFKDGKLQYLKINKDHILSVDNLIMVLEKKKDPSMINQVLDLFVKEIKVDLYDSKFFGLKKEHMTKLIVMAGKGGNIDTLKYLYDMLDRFDVNLEEKKKIWYYTGEAKPDIDEAKLRAAVKELETSLGTEIVLERNKIVTAYNRYQKLVKTDKSLESDNKTGIKLRRLLRRKPELSGIAETLSGIIFRKHKSTGLSTKMENVVSLLEDREKVDFLNENISIFSENAFLIDYLLSPTADPDEIVRNAIWDSPQNMHEIGGLIGIGDKLSRKKFEYFSRLNIEENKKAYKAIESMLEDKDQIEIAGIFGEAVFKIERKQGNISGNYFSIRLERTTGGSDFPTWSIGVSSRGEIIYGLFAGNKVPKRLRGVMHGRWNSVSIDRVFSLFPNNLSQGQVESVYQDFLFGYQNKQYSVV